ncbi:protein EVI2B [Emydura macquarii macquarii]|uniref:protein EVI2B n=1 Tax=Emydura macquarii macquarii TaxID=1129001 RepID=UPI00352B9F3B
MDTNHIILIFFYGQLWRSFSMETQMPPITLSTVFQSQPRNTSVSLGGKKGNTGPMFPPQSAELATLQKTEKPPVALMTPHITSAKESESSDGSRVAAMLIGIILTSMIIAIIIILLWKCSKKPAPIDPNWAGRSPFADGDTPDMFVETIKEMDQAPKRTSFFSTLPWKFNKNTHSLDDAEGSELEKRPEKSPSCNTKEKNSQSTPTLTAGSGPFVANVSVSNSINVPSSPVSDALSEVCDQPSTQSNPLPT